MVGVPIWHFHSTNGFHPHHNTYHSVSLSTVIIQEMGYDPHTWSPDHRSIVHHPGRLKTQSQVPWALKQYRTLCPWQDIICLFTSAQALMQTFLRPFLQKDNSKAKIQLHTSLHPLTCSGGF